MVLILPFVLFQGMPIAEPKEPPIRHITPQIIVVEAKACETIKEAVDLYKLPYFDGAWQMVGRCDVPVNDTATAMVIFYNMWVEKFDDPGLVVYKALDTMLIEWGNDPRHVKAAYDMQGNLKKNARVIGLCLTKSIIWVERDEWNNIYNSALIHELVHAALWAEVGEPDADHEGKVYKGWTQTHTKFIEEVNEVLLMMGI